MNVTISIDAAQARAIQASITRQNNPAITNETAYCQNVVNIDVAQRQQELRGSEIDPLTKRWDSLSDAQKATIRATAGIP